MWGLECGVRVVVVLRQVDKSVHGSKSWVVLNQVIFRNVDLQITRVLLDDRCIWDGDALGKF